MLVNLFKNIFARLYVYKPSLIRMSTIDGSKRKRTTRNSNKTDPIKEENKENDPSPYFGQKSDRIKMNQNELSQPQGLKNNKNMMNMETAPKISSLIAQIKEEAIEDVKDMAAADLPGVKKQKLEPENWLQQFDLIRQMRSQWDAPVDTMGCDSNWDANAPPNVKRFHILVSLMLSSQTKDEVTAKAVNELKKFPLEIDTMLATDADKIAQAIYPVSFYKRKAEYIQKTCKILKEKFNNDIPDSIEELMKLPGVGPKMAYLAMSCAWNKTVGIGVDTHVHRISNRLGWTKSETKTPEQTRKQLEEWLPQWYWDEVNHLLVGFGQTVCRPVGPKCTTCLCKEICPTGRKVAQTKKARVKIEVTEKD